MAEYSLGSVVLFGFGTVFIGLILLILVTKLTGMLIGNVPGKTKAKAPAKTPENGAGPDRIGDRGAFSAAVAAAVSQCMGTNVSGIRIVSIKKVNRMGEE